MPAPEKGGGTTPVIVGIVIAVIAVLLLMMRRGKRRQAKVEDDDRAPRSFRTLEEAQADADARNEALGTADAASAAGIAAVAGAAGKSVERSEPDAVAASPTPSEDELPPPTEARAAASGPAASAAKEAAPFAPVAPAARHPDFVPPLPDAPRSAVETDEPRAGRSAEHEAEKWQAEEREAAARQAAAQEAEEQENRAREAAAREALARELAAREVDSREAELRELTGREEQAREAAAREIIAREAELRELRARSADEQAALEAQQRPGLELDEEPALAHSFPMPKFPQEAIQALDSLDMGLPPRMELKLNQPGTAEPATATPPPVASTPPSTLEPPPREARLEASPSSGAAGAQSIEQAPFVPQPVAQPNPAQQADSVAKQPQSVASQIEAGTAGAASVAGLGATKFGPLSLDFDLGPSSSATEPLPALTSAQLATIARNKLELAAEYIELGDLQGARTLLQEVIESNDPATRQQAATLLSTLAPHS
ncbi:transmembrane protein [Caballeronia ptereochthonis]|uniref:Transmembrane protein n=1 Tax=Caballeronia ptereochthonis TaxID=1777144 RepID=A0A158E7B6_9BURK|nr:transmembrane protein [Caballeronia ptereochthonis]